MNKTEIKTKYEELKEKVLAHLFDYYDYLNRTHRERNVIVKEDIKDYHDTKPTMYVYIEGGMIQDISANCDISVHIYDRDNYKSDPEYAEIMGTPYEWDQMVKQLTKEGKIKPIY